ncbi:hypothetical protein LA080_008997 [Diaporthe eres]|nr:hypothetical protein LA080_008997 [Diaporthe eres]
MTTITIDTRCGQITNKEREGKTGCRKMRSDFPFHKLSPPVAANHYAGRDQPLTNIVEHIGTAPTGLRFDEEKPWLALACRSETRTTVASHQRSRSLFLPAWLYVIILSTSYQITEISGRPGLIGEVALQPRYQELEPAPGPVTGLDDQPVDQADEKGHVAVDSASDSGLGSDDERNTGGLAGVERIEATAKTWTKAYSAFRGNNFYF